jgi:hypothetical protein
MLPKVPNSDFLNMPFFSYIKIPLHNPYGKIKLSSLHFPGTSLPQCPREWHWPNDCVVAKANSG